jgi:hypothetical protein
MGFLIIQLYIFKGDISFMEGFAKAIVTAIICGIVFLLFTNFIMFFPWYMTLVYETYNLSTIAANYNYLPQDEKEFILENLKVKPIFSERGDAIEVRCDFEGEHSYDYYRDMDYTDKPYCQRGEKFSVSIKAAFPFKITVGGKEVEKSLDVVFTLPVTGTRYYKDLVY